MRELIEKPALIIFSVSQVKLNELDNAVNHTMTLNELDRMNIGYKLVNGSYEGILEKSILVVDTESNREVVLGIASEYNQHSILLIEADTRKASLLYLETGMIESVGVLTEVSEREAKASSAYTYDSENNAYYMAK